MRKKIMKVALYALCCGIVVGIGVLVQISTNMNRWNYVFGDDAECVKGSDR